MKKILSLVLLLGLLSTTIFAADDPIKVNRKVESSLLKKFSGASYVSWQVMKEQRIYHATFIYNHQRLNAFLDDNGELIATGRYIPALNLPLLVTRNIQEKYSSYILLESIEYIKGNETSYILKLDNPKKSLTVHAFATGSSYVFKKEKK